MTGSSPRFTALVGAGSALAGALLGAAVGYIGVRDSVDGQLRQQRQAFREARAIATREQRAQTYSAYLDAANTFAVAVEQLARTLSCRDGLCAVTPATRQTEAWSRYQTARFGYQGALNDVYVYGSDEANELRRAVAAALPRALVTADEEQDVLSRIDTAAFLSAYQAFQELQCREVPPRPRRNCVE